MLTRNIHVPFSSEELDAIGSMMEQDVRGSLKDQIRFCVIEEARRRGLLPSPSYTPTDKHIDVAPVYGPIADDVALLRSLD